MIFFISQDSMNTSSLTSQNVQVLLDFLRINLRTGSHRIIIDPTFIDSIRKFEDASKRDQNILRSLENDFVTSRSIIDNIPVFVQIQNLDASSFPQCTYSGNQLKISLSIDYLEKYLPNIIKESPLLVEDAFTDGEFLVQASKTLAKKMRWGEVSLLPDHGGGSGITRRAEQRNRDGIFTIVVVDCDKGCPESALGSTAKTLKKAAKHFGPLIHTFILPVHEIENLIPFSAIARIAPAMAVDYQKYIMHGTFGFSSDIDCPSRYFDIKNGIHFDAGSSKKHDEYTAWLKKYFGVSLPSHIHIAGYPSIMENFINDQYFYDEIHREIFAKDITEDILKILLSIASFGMARKPKRTL